MTKLLAIGTDQKLFELGSDVRARQIAYAKNLEALHIIVFTTQKFPAQQFCANGWVYATNSWSRWFYVFDALNLGKQIIADQKISEITCQDPFLTAMVALRLKQKFLIPLEMQVHTDIGSEYFTYNFSNKIRKILARYSLPKANKIRVVSGRIKNYLIEKLKIPEERITIRPVVVDLEKIKNAKVTVDLHQKYPNFRKIILMASRLTKEKDIPTALKAFEIVSQQYPDAGLVIVGSGPEKFGEIRGVILEPWVDQETLFSYYKTADVFLSTSLYEGYGLSMQEASISGLKIVATDAGIATELTKQVCPVGDAQCLVEKICQLWTV